MTALEERLGHSFRNRALLETAVTHSSYANENRASGIVCNERLEFLGDSVLGVTVADFLYRHFPDMPEGRMTRLRAELVCEQSLHRVALELHLGDYLRLLWARIGTPMAVMSTASDVAARSGLYASFSIVMPRTVQTIMARITPTIGGRLNLVQAKKQIYAPTMMTSPWAKFSIFAMP